MTHKDRPCDLPGRNQRVGDAVVFMASTRASFVSGTVVTVDGGHGGNLSSYT
jgi:NAD(P)-dependent dehydrogenase (short-subunit alcohol dehydrogenase family)